MTHPLLPPNIFQNPPPGPPVQAAVSVLSGLSLALVGLGLSLIAVYLWAVYGISENYPAAHWLGYLASWIPLCLTTWGLRLAYSGSQRYIRSRYAPRWLIAEKVKGFLTEPGAGWDAYENRDF